MHKNINIKGMWKTALTQAKAKSDSLRTAVPIAIVKKLKLDKDNWELCWDMDKEDGKWIIIVKPVKKENKED